MGRIDGLAVGAEAGRSVTEHYLAKPPKLLSNQGVVTCFLTKKCNESSRAAQPKPRLDFSLGRLALIFFFLVVGGAGVVPVASASGPVQPHVLAQGAYVFSEWSPASPAGSYPPHMIFRQSQSADPGLAVEMDGDWNLAYNLATRSRINGLGADGISFVNTGNTQAVEGAGYVGAAVLALNTLGESGIQVQWTAGTVAPNDRVYGLRLQYRVGATGAFVDVLDPNGAPYDYQRNEVVGHVESFGPVFLPESVEDQAHVELRWKYYHVAGQSGPRAELRLDNILVVSGTVATATTLVFANQPPEVGQSGDLLPSLMVRAVDEQGLTDVSFEAPVTLLLAGGGELVGLTTRAAVEGVAVFPGLAIQGAGAMVLTAEGGGLAPASTQSFAVVQVTEVSMPQYMQGDQDLEGNNNNRVPFVFRLRLDGLLPHATYRYGNRVVQAGDPADQNGAGNAILITGPTTDWIRNTNAPRFNPEDFGARHLTFATDGSGSYSGWFVTEPTGNARFTPGNTVFVRLLLNDGQGGTDLHHFLTAPSGIEVRRLGTEATEASAIYGDASVDPRNIVLFYDNVEGSGRPLGATMVENTGVETDLRYADFYLAQVAGREGRWGSLIPNALASGLRRVEERSLLDGEILGVATSANGFGETTNSGGGLNPVFIDTAGGAEFLPVNDGAWGVSGNWSNGTVPHGVDDRASIHMTAAFDRTVTLTGGITIGSLTWTNQTAARDRIFGGLGESLRFEAEGTEAILSIGRQGSGFHELQVEGGVFLASDLRVTVNNITAGGEYGALRIREIMQGPGALIKDGFGVLSLTGGQKNYTGETRIESGVLRVTEASRPGLTSGVSVARTGQLRLVSQGENRVYPFGGPLILNSSGPDEGPVALPQGGRLGALRLDPELELRPSSESRHTGTVPNAIELAGDSHIHVDGTANRLTLGGSLSGLGSLIKSGGGDLILTGDNSQFDGGVTLHNGSVYVEMGSSLGTGPLGFVPSSNAVTQLFLNNGTQTVSSLATTLDGSGTATLVLGPNQLLEIDQATDVLFAGSLVGTGSVRKRGEGVLRLTRGPNGFSGALEVAAGVLEVTESSQPFAVSQVSVLPGGELRLTSTGPRTYSFGSGPLILHGAGALRQEGEAGTDVATVTNAVEIGGDTAQIHVNRELDEGSVLVLAGDISGSGHLGKTGGGTLELRGPNSNFTGGTLMDNGLVRVMPGSRLGSGPLHFTGPERTRRVELYQESQTIAGLSGTLADGGSLQVSLAPGHTLTVAQAFDTVFAGSLDGAGNLVKSGSGRLVLSGDHTLSGALSVNEGSLRVDGLLVGPQSLTIAPGARLEGTGLVSELAGGGTVAPGQEVPGILGATMFQAADGLGADFRFSQIGPPTHSNRSASGNDLLRLSGTVPFGSALTSENALSLYFDVVGLSPGDVFKGGFFTEMDGALADKIRNANTRYYLRDLNGAHEYRGTNYRSYDGPLYPILDSTPEAGGQVMRIHWTNLKTFGDWQAFYFPDPDDQTNPQTGGAAADPNGHGMSNLVKYALGLEAVERFDAGRLETVLDDQGRLAISFHRDPAKQDIAYLVEGSTDLLGWDLFYDSRQVTDLDDGGRVETVLVPPEPDSGDQARFVRLRILLLTE